VSTYKFDVNDTLGFFCPVSIKCGNVDAKVGDTVLLDTGAGICHITFPMWCNLGLNKVCFDEKEDLLKLMGVDAPEEMTFDKIPFAPLPDSKATEVGNGIRVRTYEFRVDELILGDASKRLNSLVFKNISVRLIDSPRQEFMVGLNVLRYTKIHYQPTPKKAICQLSLDNNGRQLLEHHRSSRGINNLQNNFDYLQ
jgi:hypothetical protein